MTLFLQSSKAVSAACQEIADAAGASADHEMRNRALNALNAATQYLNGRAYWDFLLVEGPSIDIKGPFLFGVTASAGQSSCSASAASHGVLPGDYVLGDIFAPGTRVSATATQGITLNRALSTGLSAAGLTSVTATFGRDTYPCPTDFRAEYSARMLSSQRIIRMLRRRLYDRSTVDEYATNVTPLYYDPFLVGASGVMRFLPPPSVNDTFQWRYYRHMATAATSATAIPLDIPSQYEGYLIAQAKWMFLVDKSEGRSEQAQVWMSFAQEGLKVMLKDNVNLPDEDLVMFPGAYSYNTNWGPNSTRPFLDEPW